MSEYPKDDNGLPQSPLNPGGPSRMDRVLLEPLNPEPVDRRDPFHESRYLGVSGGVRPWGFDDQKGTMKPGWGPKPSQGRLRGLAGGTEAFAVSQPGLTISPLMRSSRNIERLVLAVRELNLDKSPQAGLTAVQNIRRDLEREQERVDEITVIQDVDKMERKAKLQDELSDLDRVTYQAERLFKARVEAHNARTKGLSPGVLSAALKDYTPLNVTTAMGEVYEQMPRARHAEQDYNYINGLADAMGIQVIEGGEGPSSRDNAMGTFKKLLNPASLNHTLRREDAVGLLNYVREELEFIADRAAEVASERQVEDPTGLEKPFSRLGTLEQAIRTGLLPQIDTALDTAEFNLFASSMEFEDLELAVDLGAVPGKFSHNYFESGRGKALVKKRGESVDFTAGALHIAYLWERLANAGGGKIDIDENINKVAAHMVRMFLQSINLSYLSPTSVEEIESTLIPQLSPKQKVQMLVFLENTNTTLYELQIWALSNDDNHDNTLAANILLDHLLPVSSVLGGLCNKLDS